LLVVNTQPATINQLLSPINYKRNINYIKSFLEDKEIAKKLSIFCKLNKTNIIFLQQQKERKKWKRNKKCATIVTRHFPFSAP
jgi:hypothetical protein